MRHHSGRLGGAYAHEQSVIARLESGGTYLTLSTLERVSDALDAELVVGFEDALPPGPIPVLASAASRILRVTTRRRSVNEARKTDGEAEEVTAIRSSSERWARAYEGVSLRSLLNKVGN